MNLTLQQRLLFLPGLAFVGLLAVQGVNSYATHKITREVVLPSLDGVMMAEERTSLKALVESEAETLARRVEKSPTRAEKVAAIIAETDPIRFFDDRSGYFFVYDLDGVRINVPTNKADNGKNLIGLVDNNGFPFVRALVDQAKAGGGYVTYHFPKPGSGIQPKMACVQPIRGTDFLVGAGVYIDNVEAAQAGLSKRISAEQQTYFLYIAMAFVLVLTGTLAVTLLVSKSVAASVRRIVLKLHEASRHVGAAAGELSSQSQSLAQGANEQAATVEETTATLTEISSMTRRNKESAGRTVELAKLAQTAADQGTADMQQLSEAIEAMNASSDEIAKVIETIGGIAFQTNILALNAAVEAARAGEAGMGFSVVADEVRNLAQRSAQAARDTSERIEGSVAKAASGMSLGGKVRQSLEDIVGRVRQVGELAAEAAGSSNQQTSAIEQISIAIGGINGVTQTTAANAEESAASAEELNAQALSMQDAVSQLLSLVGEAASDR